MILLSALSAGFPLYRFVTMTGVPPSGFSRQLWSASRRWWREQARANGAADGTSLLVRSLWGFVRESTPGRRRQRYGDMEYDWEYRVNTTGGTVGWRARLLGVFYSPYQATDPALFREMMASLPIEFDRFTFVDLGSGKGRTLLMASEYPFRRIVGVELIAELHRAAEENIRMYHSATERCTQIEAVCADACEFVLPDTPLVLYLFNPLSEAGLQRVLRNLERSLEQSPRWVWILYHNPAMDGVLEASRALVKVCGTEQYSLFRSDLVSRFQSFEVAKTRAHVSTKP
jgi:Histone methylation protein DOT1